MKTNRARASARRARRRRGERSAILVLSALLMIAMLTMAAIAIDLSNARQVRRHAQGSADAAALAGAQELPDPNAVVSVVKDYATRNYGTSAADWVGCVDPEHLTELPDNSSNSNQCISLDEPSSRVRVRLPETDVKTYFGSVVGLDEIVVGASAVAQADLVKDDRIIPATVAASAGSGNLCIENSGNDVGCSNRSSGNFGSFDSRRMNIYQPTSSVQPDSLRINYSMGVDHILSIYGTGSPKVCDLQTQSPCSTNNSASGTDANHLIPYTGNAVPPLTDGLAENATISTSDMGNNILFCGRLRRPDLTADNISDPAPENCNHWLNAPGPGPSMTVLGEKVNGRHADYWMLPEFQGIFYPSLSPATKSAQDMSPATYWDSGDLKLECFMQSYRFDYTGSKGHTPQTEFFIDPSKAINTNGDGTEFTLAQAKAYLKAPAAKAAGQKYCTGAGLPAAVVDAKLASLTDSADFWPMFDGDIVGDPRFGMIPVVANFGNGGSTAMPIVRFWSIYLYRLYTTNTKVKAVDAWAFEPALIETDSGIADLQFGYKSPSPVIHLVE